MEEVFVYIHLCLNNTVGFPELLEAIVAKLLLNHISIHKLHCQAAHLIQALPCVSTFIFG